jgi:mannosyltransferase OCH1-like enzyme
MNLIPKVIYQTWKTKNLDLPLQMVRNNIQKRNPDYEMVLFDDEDIERWIINTFQQNNLIYNTYKKLKVGAARADFWRYLILYINGGVYLDIDSDITGSLDLLIEPKDQAIVSRERYSGNSHFIQWCLMFAPNHPILLKAINICIYNINNKVSSWLPKLTGPGVFTNAVNFFLKKHYLIDSKINLYYFGDEYLNSLFNNNNKITCRFYGKDYENLCTYDNGCKELILKNAIYWKEDKEIFNE